MNWYSTQQQQQKYNQFHEKQVDHSFEGIYDDVFTSHYDFWMPMLEEDQEDYRLEIMDQQQIIQGKLFQKDSQSRKWEAQHLELFQDKLVRVQAQPDDTYLFEYCRVNQCFMKKIRYSESSFQSYKYGFRLQTGKEKAEFFTESNDIFMKWHNHLKRYTLLLKFSKKYKLGSRIKIPDQLQASSTYQCIKIADNLQYQVRITEKHNLSDKQRLQLLKEIKILRRLDHQYISKLLEVYEDANFVYMVFDCFAGREIKHSLQDITQASENLIAELMYKLLQGLCHCHSKNVIHGLRDLKFDTVFHKLPNSLTEICILNFSTAEIYDRNAKGQFKKIGTPGFLAPEVFKSKFYDPKVDIFSIGVMFYFFVFAKMPFGNGQPEIMMKNEKGDIDLQQRSRFSSSAVDLICLMVEKDPNKRPFAFQALNHHWFLNLKIKQQVGRNALNTLGSQYSEKNLSTIVEKSDFLDISSTSMNQVFKQSKRMTRPQTREKIYEAAGHYEEFEDTSLQDKLLGLQILCPQKIPSRHGHKKKSSPIIKVTTPVNKKNTQIHNSWDGLLLTSQFNS